MASVCTPVSLTFGIDLFPSPSRQDPRLSDAAIQSRSTLTCHWLNCPEQQPVRLHAAIFLFALTSLVGGAFSPEGSPVSIPQKSALQHDQQCVWRLKHYTKCARWTYSFTTIDIDRKFFSAFLRACTSLQFSLSGTKVYHLQDTGTSWMQGFSPIRSPPKSLQWGSDLDRPVIFFHTRLTNVSLMTSRISGTLSFYWNYYYKKIACLYVELHTPACVAELVKPVS